MNIVYSTEYSKLSPEYAKSNTMKYKDIQSLPTLLDLANVYVQLMNIGRYEDALIIHLMYSLAANPETLSLLTFSSIDKVGKIRFWDTLTASQVEINLNDNLIRDIMFFKNWRITIIRQLKQYSDLIFINKYYQLSRIKWMHCFTSLYNCPQ